MSKLFSILRAIATPAIMSPIIICSIITIILLSCGKQQRKPVEGTWNLVYWQSVSDDSVNWKFSEKHKGNQLKIWSDNHFIFVGRFELDTTAINSYGGGTYTLDGNRYEEKIINHVAPSWVGTKNKMLLEIKGDSLIQSYPVDDNWQIDKANYSVEKYVRLK
ncbi:MAG: DUF4488 domain-containing protein [Bacteroidales bacterium]|nr:DUF4488 domain-containing protein [Bacteroidales bacterium]